MRIALAVLASSAVLSLAARGEEAAAPAAAVAKPSPDAVKSTWDFFYKGKGGGVVLVDAKLCLEVAKAGENKSECSKEAPAEGVKAGTLVLIWQAYLLPQGDTVEDLTLQVKQGDVIRETQDVSKLKGEGWRSRTWNGVKVSKPGTWTFSIMRGTEVLKSFTLQAT